MTVKYVNRQREVRYLHDDGQGQVWMTGDLGYIRVGGEPDNIQFVDVAGGPMISIGHNIEEFFQDNRDRIVERIEICEVIKLYYTISQE